MRHFSSSSFVLATAVCASLRVLGAETDALTEFHIEAQSLSTAIRAYAVATGDQVVFFSEIGKQRQTKSVHGRYTRDEALAKMLENTDLSFQRLNTKTVGIGSRTMLASDRSDTPVRLAQNNPSPAVIPAAAPQRGSAESDTTPVVRNGEAALEEVVVTGTAVPERTRFDTSVAISTFSAEDIAQQSPMSSAALIAAVPGFWVESTAGTTQGNVFARGIIQDGGYRYVGLMEDGLPIYPVFELSFYNPDQFVRVDDTIDHVEALRGGTAPIFVSGAVGGTINFVTQRPTDTPRGSAKLSSTDYGSYRGDFAWRGPITNNWGFALGGYYRRSDGIRDPGYEADEGGQLRVALARSFDSGRLEFFGKYIDDRSLFAVPIPLQGNASDPHTPSGEDPGKYSLHSSDLARAPLPASAREVGLENASLEDGIHPQLFTGGAKLAWRFSEAVTLDEVLRYTDGEVGFDGIFPGAAPVTGTEFATAAGVPANYTVLATGAPYAATQLVQNHGHWAVHKDYTALQNDLRVSLKSEGNSLAIGFYVADYSMQDRWSLGNLLLMDLSNRPQRLALPGITDPNGFTQYAFFNLRTDYDATSYALYASDEWQVTDALRLDFGIRYNDESIDAKISNAANVNLDGNPATRYDNATSLAGPLIEYDVPNFSHTDYSVGFNYEFTKAQALFGHYTMAAKLPHFDDVRGASSNFGNLEVDEVENIEVGYKIATPLIGLFATLFQTEFDNVPFQDILANGQTVVRRAGTRTRGIELEGVVQPLDELAIRFSVTEQDPEYTSFSGATIDNTGNQIRRIPKSMIRLTPSYTFLEDRASVFATYTHAGKRYANDENTIALPGYDTLDIGGSYSINETWTVQLNIANVTDEVGLTEGNPRTDVGASGVGAVYLARPLFARSYTLAIGARF